MVLMKPSHGCDGNMVTFEGIAKNLKASAESDKPAPDDLDLATTTTLYLVATTIDPSVNLEDVITVIYVNIR